MADTTDTAGLFPANTVNAIEQALRSVLGIPMDDAEIRSAATHLFERATALSGSVTAMQDADYVLESEPPQHDVTVTFSDGSSEVVTVSEALTGM